MEGNAVREDSATRRAFLRTAGLTLVGGSAVFVAACGANPRPDHGGAGRPYTDGDILNAALDLEYTMVAAYAAGAERLRGAARALGRRFEHQERAHAAALARAVAHRGGTPHEPRTSYAGILPGLATGDDVLKFARAIENDAIATYLDAIPRLAEPRLRAMAATIVTDEAEHVAVLRGALGLRPVPSAFANGMEG